MTDYERGVEQASHVYQKVIREYVAENEKLRKLCVELWCSCPVSDDACVYCKHGGSKGTVDCDLWDTMHKLYEEVKGDE